MYIKTSESSFKKLLENTENEHIEFKKAKNNFSEDKDLPDYCAALANELGGKLILGVDNKRNIHGTNVYEGNESKLAGLIFSKLRLKVYVEVLFVEKKRILIVHIPSRLLGQPVKSTGHYRYPMRTGESLAEMDALTLKNILNENEPDYTAEIVDGLQITELDKVALQKLNDLLKIKQGSKYKKLNNKDLLDNLNLITPKGITYAGLILAGSSIALKKYLPDAEIIFEWRQEATKNSHDFRKSWREAFVNIFDDIWTTINARNLRIPFQEGFVQREIYAFAEKSIREAVLNAVAHRDYRILGRSIFINANPAEFNIESPGGFISGINPENILSLKAWRNRTLAEALEKLGLVERSGQGMNEIYEATIRDGKGLPDLSKSDNESVNLSIPASVKDSKFILFLEKVTLNKKIPLSTQDVYDLERIRENKQTQNLKSKDRLIEAGLIEKTGTGRGVRYILSYKYYSSQGIGVIHTKLVGLEREKVKELIYAHLAKHKKAYFKEFRTSFLELKPKYLTNLLQELKASGKIDFNKEEKYWFTIR